MVHYLLGHGGWNIEDIKDLHPGIWVVDQILGSQLALNEMWEDTVIWARSPNGIFSTKSAYDALLGSHGHDESLWKSIWKWDRTKSFLWTIAKDGLKIPYVGLNMRLHLTCFGIASMLSRFETVFLTYMGIKLFPIRALDSGCLRT